MQANLDINQLNNSHPSMLEDPNSTKNIEEEDDAEENQDKVFDEMQIDEEVELKKKIALYYH